MGREEIGNVFHYYTKAGVAAIAITAGELKVGDTIMIEGATSSVTMQVESMQIEHAQVQEARAGQSIGIKVPERVRPGDKVYRVDMTP
ncbi:MAG: translation elongation factor-like protein [Euryarchaeota archaeon]|nr:translation elongation factor-like protein [Euryarchaeota archaeon]